MHNDVDHQEKVEVCSGTNPFDNFIFGDNDQVKERSEREAKEEDLILAAKFGKTLLEQIEELTAEKRRIFRKLEVSAYF